jgi:SAM-dependent methyltransferase
MFDALKHRLHLLAYTWRKLGPAMLRHTLRWPLDGEARNSNSGFDARFGTDTTAALTPVEAELPAGRRDGATMYLPSLDQDLDAMVAALDWPEALAQATTFVDIGSGKGRVVMLAAMRSFREVIGVELSPVLHAIAQRNLDIVGKRGAFASPARVTLGDATELDVPRGPLIAYLYHPFREPIASLVIDRLVASLAAAPRPAAILYGHPTLQAPLDPAVFARGDMFGELARGERRTRHYRIGWSVWTNEAWLASVERAVGG